MQYWYALVENDSLLLLPSLRMMGGECNVDGLDVWPLSRGLAVTYSGYWPAVSEEVRTYSYVVYVGTEHIVRSTTCSTHTNE